MSMGIPFVASITSWSRLLSGGPGWFGRWRNILWSCLTRRTIISLSRVRLLLGSLRLPGRMAPF
eukprot:7537131-Prorocentrum_lima.AAC.1